MVGNPVTAEIGGRQPDWLPGFVDALTDLSSNPDRPISAAWATSVTMRLHNPQFLDLVDRFHELNPGATPSEAQRRFLSAEQAALLAAQEAGELPDDLPGYPSQAYAEHTAWPAVYKWLRTDTHGYGNQYFGNVIKRPLTTSVSQREVAARLLRRFLPHLMGEEPLWASCGCSDMAGDRRNWLADHDPEFKFDWVSVRSNASGSTSAISGYKSDLLNAVVLEPDTTQRVVGLDQFDPTDPVNVAWSHACATPEEIMSGKWDEMHDRIMRAQVPREYLGFYIADLAARKSIRAVVNENGGTFDAAYASFSWYQGPAEIRRRKLLNMRNELVDPNKVIIIADFARVVGGGFLSPENQWRQPTVFVGHQGLLHPVFRANNGRFQEIRVLPALAALAKGGPHEKTSRELLA